MPLCYVCLHFVCECEVVWPLKLDILRPFSGEYVIQVLTKTVWHIYAFCDFPFLNYEAWCHKQDGDNDLLTFSSEP